MASSAGKQAVEYRFGRCRINLDSREVWRNDELVPIEPKAYDLLVYLIANRARAVDKNELQDQIWAGTIVTEAALTRCVMKARRAIGDDVISTDLLAIEDLGAPHARELEIPRDVLVHELGDVMYRATMTYRERLV